MKKTIILLFIAIPYLLSSQISDDFSDGDFTQNPTWIGNNNDFRVNADGELQTNISGKTGSSYLSTKTEIANNATWEFTVKIKNKTSSANNIVVYLMSDMPNPQKELNGYYVLIGGTKDKISLYRQRRTLLGEFPKEIIKGTNKCIDFKNVEVNVKVTRSTEGKFQLFRKIKGKNENYILEGTQKDTVITTSKYFSLVANYTKTTGKNYFFDNIKITGEISKDTIPPKWISATINIQDSSRMELFFSEPINISKASFDIDNGIGKPTKVELTDNKVYLQFQQKLKKNNRYNITVKNIMDYDGNTLQTKTKQIVIPDKLIKGDLIINEIMFNPKEGLPEYFEIYNISEKILNLESLYFGTNSQKKKAKYKFAYKLPNNTLIFPKKYIAITKESNILKKEFNVSDTANIINVTKFPTLSNTGTTLYIINKKDSLIYDEVSYSEKWHHPIIKNAQGVSLEKINPLFNGNDKNAWHSASFNVNYGTPGYKNSQYVENPKTNKKAETTVRIDPEVFSPDNDGNEDVCFIRYKTENIGNIANIIIFTSAGVKVKQIASNHLLSTNGYLIWDGKTDRNQNVNPGIYVLYFEVINISTGDREVYKIPIVVSAR